MKSKRKALRSLTQEKIVNIGDYRSLKTGRKIRRVAVVTTDPVMLKALKLEPLNETSHQAEFQFFDSRFSLDQALKSSEWDGIVLDERTLHDDALQICEKIKKSSKTEELFVVIISDRSDKDLVRQGYEKGCDEWITRLDDIGYLARLLSHHLD